VSILSDTQIREMKLMSIEPFYEDGLTPNGYDVRIAEVFVSEHAATVADGVASVPPKSWFAVSTEECVRCGPEVAAELWIKTSWARKGVISSFGMIDAGFEGTLTLSAFNGSHEPLAVPVGKRFAQMVFHRMDRVPEALYDKRSGNYQGQRGVTLSKD